MFGVGCVNKEREHKRFLAGISHTSRVMTKSLRIPGGCYSIFRGSINECLIYVYSHQGDIRQNQKTKKQKQFGERRHNFKTWRVMTKSLRILGGCYIIFRGEKRRTFKTWRGHKHRPWLTSHMSCGDLVIIFPYLLSREDEKEIQDLA